MNVLPTFLQNFPPAKITLFKSCYKDPFLKVACTSGPIFGKIMKQNPLFSVQIIYNQIDLMHK